MSEYQYYEFCSLKQPLSSSARKDMGALSSRALITTHGASYVYNFGGSFRGDPKKLLLKYFDIFFYIANWGDVQLMFKFLAAEVDAKEFKPYLITDVISVAKYNKYIVLDIVVSNEDGFGWTEGEGILPLLLPIHAEIIAKKYKFLDLVGAINHEFTGDEQDTLGLTIAKIRSLSKAQKAFINCVGLGEHE